MREEIATFLANDAKDPRILGLVTVLLLGGVLKQFVFGVNPRSVGVLAAVSLGMLVIGIGAALPSVVRAMRVDIRRGISW